MPTRTSVEQIEQLELLAVVRTRRIAEPGPDAAVTLGHDVFRRQPLLRRPNRARRRVKIRGERFRQPIGQRLDHDGVVVVVRPFEAVRELVGAEAGGDRERSDVVVDRQRRSIGHEIGQRQVRLAVGDRLLLPQHVEPQSARCCGSSSAIDQDVVAVAGRRPEAIDAARREQTARR